MSSPPGKIRIVAGEKRGHRIRVPSSNVSGGASAFEVRPTSERIREAIFSALGPVADLRVLDLFAGTGAMGLEALSRGAKHCVFVESHPQVASVIQKNVATLGYESLSQVLTMDYLAAISHLQRKNLSFELLFLDPPYRMLSVVAAKLIPKMSHLLTENGAIVIEGHKEAQNFFPKRPIFDRVYGDTRVTMITMNDERTICYGRQNL